MGTGRTGVVRGSARAVETAACSAVRASERFSTNELISLSL